MNLYSIETGNFKLDGGAMFGVVPKSLWEKTNPPDELNRIKMSARSLLIEDENKLILIDVGNKKPMIFVIPKFNKILAEFQPPIHCRNTSVPPEI